MSPTATAPLAPESTPSKDLSTDNAHYVRWDQPDVEQGDGPEEAHVINQIAQQINTAQQAVLDAHHHSFSGTHVKVSESFWYFTANM